ncbi:hypothetical protein AAHA92_32980 [Salvia divinorum]|uniref:Uncharacterized protein n=1 Tax=Salvia divinorum TaxID=28513 RepID=A0ABD1FMH1_SALDI
MASSSNFKIGAPNSSSREFSKWDRDAQFPLPSLTFFLKSAKPQTPFLSVVAARTALPPAFLHPKAVVVQRSNRRRPLASDASPTRTLSASLFSRLSSFSGPSSRAFSPFRSRAVVHPPSSHLQFRFAVAARSWSLHAAAAGQLAPPLLKLKNQNEISSSRIC